MAVILRWTRLVLSFCFFGLCLLCLLNYQTSVYLIYQANGQLSVLTNTRSLAEFKEQNKLSPQEIKNLLLIEEVKKYSVDSLGFSPTHNFTTIYDQHHSPVLWVITACEPYAFSPYKWSFPIVGQVSYKGFFKKDLAEKEKQHMMAQGFDVDLRSASAWSTLGWFKDPLLSSMLGRSRGGLCNLLFHELFHATYYAPGSVDFNENMASFVAHEATLQFLKNDTAALRQYTDNYTDNHVYTAYMLRKKIFLENYYKMIAHQPNRLGLKLAVLAQVADSISLLPLKNKPKFTSRKEEILLFKNAYFVDFQQYDSMQDSLENVFNKIYAGNLKKLVRDLKAN